MIAVRFRGPIARWTGYTKGFQAVVRRLSKRNDIILEVMPTNNHVPEGIGQDILDLIPSSPRFHKLGILVGKPDKLGTLGTNYKVVYSMYETTSVPTKWVGDINCADEIWVPTQFCLNMFRKHNKHTKVVPWGYDETIYKQRKKEKKDYYEFGTVGVMGRRKGIDVLVKAFSLAFPDESDVFLTIKTRDTRWLPNIDDSRVAVIDTDWSDDELANFYNRIDCLVQPSRGEAVGMPTLEAAACGTPVIATNWGGPADFIDNHGIWGLNTTGLSRVLEKEMDAVSSYWAEPDVNHLVDLMRFMYEDTPVVKGNYTKHSFDAMAKEFASAISLAWGRANR